jgi:acyl-coenzyme A thioesterase PaaI-like protein
MIPFQPSQTGQDWHRPICFGCGTNNPQGLHADFRFDEETGEVRFRFLPTEFHTGAPGFVHGGIIATILDEAQGMLCFHIGHIVMTDLLRIQYKKATPVDKEIDVRCWITAIRRRRIYTRATITSMDGTLLATSTARWYVLSERIMRQVFQEKFPEDERARIWGIVEENRKRAREIRRRIRAMRGSGTP